MTTRHTDKTVYVIHMIKSTHNVLVGRDQLEATAAFGTVNVYSVIRKKPISISYMIKDTVRGKNVFPNVIMVIIIKKNLKSWFVCYHANEIHIPTPGVLMKKVKLEVKAAFIAYMLSILYMIVVPDGKFRRSRDPIQSDSKSILWRSFIQKKSTNSRLWSLMLW